MCFYIVVCKLLFFNFGMFLERMFLRKLTSKLWKMTTSEDLTHQILNLCDDNIGKLNETCCKKTLLHLICSIWSTIKYQSAGNLHKYMQRSTYGEWFDTLFSNKLSRKHIHVSLKGFSQVKLEISLDSLFSI